MTEDKIEKCVRCMNGYTLDLTSGENYGECIEGCSLIINDYRCLNCYRYKYTNEKEDIKMHRCLECDFGMYPDVVTGFCKACS